MSSVLIIIVLLSFLVLVLTYLSRRKPESLSESDILNPVLTQPYQGLFAAPSAEAVAEISEEETLQQAVERRANLISRAANGDLTVLLEASSDTALYSEVLEVLTNRAVSEVESTGTTNRLDELCDYIMRHQELRTNMQLAKVVLELWQKSPERSSIANTLHLIALSDNPAIYQSAVKVLLEQWRTGSLESLSKREMYRLIESQYWVLSADARGSGAGFVLKEYLATVRRELIAP
ncbi:MAG TPA: hypothetical protein VEF04_12415 [Blastocatellia bacterium]|nr:hypothetical protein [Blastocatellia bacterium]